MKGITWICLFKILLYLEGVLRTTRLCVVYAEKHVSYEQDIMAGVDKLQLITITQETVSEAALKIRQLFGVRDLHIDRMEYQIGLIIGKTREKYKRMLDIYREMVDRVKQRNLLFPPSIWKNKPLHYALAFETMRHLELEIDQLITTLENMPTNKLDLDQFGNRENMTIPPHLLSRSRSKNKLRTGPTLDEETQTIPTALTTILSTFQNQEDLKRYYRENYNKKLGHDSNWTLDKFYGFL